MNISVYQMEAAKEPTTANDGTDDDNDGQESFENDRVINRLSTGEAKNQEENSEDAALDGTIKEKEKKLDEEEEVEAPAEAIEALSFRGKVFRTIAVYASYFAVVSDN